MHSAFRDGRGPSGGYRKERVAQQGGPELCGGQLPVHRDQQRAAGGARQVELHHLETIARQHGNPLAGTEHVAQQDRQALDAARQLGERPRLPALRVDQSRGARAAPGSLSP